jgi:nucleotidyltransferase/DNA polymerase involved in DNA repair
MRAILAVGHNAFPEGGGETGPAQQVGLKLRYADFSTVTRDHALPLPTDDPVSVRKAIGVCLRRVSLDQRLRLLGVRVGKLVPVSHGPEGRFIQPELPLFGEKTP